MAKDKTEWLRKEIRRLNHFLTNAQRAADAAEARADMAEKAVTNTIRAYEALIIRAAQQYGEKVTDESRGKVIGYRLELPVSTREETNELIGKWQVKTRFDKERDMAVYAVGLRDDPDDHKHEAELEQERKAYRESVEGGNGQER